MPRLQTSSINNKQGFILQSEQFEGIDSNKRGYDISLYKIIEKNTFAYNPARINVGSIGFSGDLENIIISSLYVCFKVRKELENSYLSQYIRTYEFNTAVRQNLEGGIREYLFYENFSNIKIPLPSNMEQQKIAACLSSLDELITAHTEKLEALKKYKKGLMQQLFPAEGETVPKLRFPEFVDSGEWEKKKVSELLLQSFYGTSKATSNIGQYPVLRMGNMYDGKIDTSNLVYIDLDEKEFLKLQLKKNDILLNRTNSFDLVGKVSIFDLDVKCVAASYIVIYRLDDNQIIPQFCNFLLNTYLYQEKIKVLSTKAVNQANINPTTFKESIFILYPSLEEQQKIADCLSSLDERMTAQTEKIAALKTHKKGLMQQLFPAVDNEVNP